MFSAFCVSSSRMNFRDCRVSLFQSAAPSPFLFAHHSAAATFPVVNGHDASEVGVSPLLRFFLQIPFHADSRAQKRNAQSHIMLCSYPLCCPSSSTSQSAETASSRTADTSGTNAPSMPGANPNLPNSRPQALYYSVKPLSKRSSAGP